MEKSQEEAAQPTPEAEKAPLDSWKEIASYLERTVRTVQRWEKKDGLPVHRHQHEKRGCRTTSVSNQHPSQARKAMVGSECEQDSYPSGG